VQGLRNSIAPNDLKLDLMRRLGHAAVVAMRATIVKLRLRVKCSRQFCRVDLYRRSRCNRFCCRRYSADEALEMGLINTVVAAESLNDEVEKWCEEIAALSPTAISIAKRSFNMDSESIRGISAFGMQALSLFYDTEESKEGVKAFMEKRPPNFRGKKD